MLQMVLKGHFSEISIRTLKNYQRAFFSSPSPDAAQQQGRVLRRPDAASGEVGEAAEACRYHEGLARFREDARRANDQDDGD